MTENLRKNPARSVPDWRITMPMAHASARCGAHTRTGKACKGPAMANGRCRMHGGPSTGPRTPEGLQRIVKARTVHGGYSAESRCVAAMIRDLKAEAKRLMELT